jgi:phosphatidylserine/phosphatidylglycerophosphate/cardiolipin synthase-like enzyme
VCSSDLMADSGGSFVSVIMSANPHDASAAHSNIALEVRGDLAGDLYRAEGSIAALSQGRLSRIKLTDDTAGEGEMQARVVTEEAIHRSIIMEISKTTAGDGIDLAMFYLSERGFVKALKEAAGRGVDIRVILDQNKDAFGYKKIGVPNKPVAHELMDDTDGRISVRWYDTKGEQFHVKLISIERGDTATVILGSANLTRRNISDYNLELDVILEGKRDSKVFTDVGAWFDRIWNNQGGEYTLAYDVCKDESLLKTIIYRVQEATGLSSF